MISIKSTIYSPFQHQCRWKRNIYTFPFTHSPLLLDHILQPRDHLVRGQRAEAKPGASRLQGGDDLGQVVADQTESRVFCKLLNHWNRDRETGRDREKAKAQVRNKCYQEIWDKNSNVKCLLEPLFATDEETPYYLNWSEFLPLISTLAGLAG